MKEWDWFTGKNTEKSSESNVKHPIIPKMNYDKLAKDKDKVIEYLLSNPKDMFKKVGIESDCMCMECHTCDHFLRDVTLFELIIKYKTLNEADLCELDKTIELDWFTISESVPLSSFTLLLKADKHFNWRAISSSYLYKKDITFLRIFTDRLHWDLVSNVDIYDIDIESLVFTEKVIPIKFAIRMKLLTVEHINKYIGQDHGR